MIWPFTKLKPEIPPYLNVYGTCNELMRNVEFHECKKYPLEVKCMDINPYIGFICSGCNQTWGIHNKNFKKTIEYMYLLNKYKFYTPDKRVAWATELSQVMTEELFCKTYQRNFLSYSDLLQTAFGSGIDMLQKYETLPSKTKHNLCLIACRHILNQMVKDGFKEIYDKDSSDKR